MSLPTLPSRHYLSPTQTLLSPRPPRTWINSEISLLPYFSRDVVFNIFKEKIYGISSSISVIDLLQQPHHHVIEQLGERKVNRISKIGCSLCGVIHPSENEELSLRQIASCHELTTLDQNLSRDKIQP